jgi:hypothetical protein
MTTNGRRTPWFTMIITSAVSIALCGIIVYSFWHLILFPAS